MAAIVDGVVATAAVAGQVTKLSLSILQLASDSRDFKEDWLTVTDNYQSKVDRLRMSISMYEKLFEDRRLHESNDLSRFLIKTLNRAESELRVEEERVKNLRERINGDHCCTWAWWLWAKLTLVFLPKQLEQAIIRVSNEINNIPSAVSSMRTSIASRTFSAFKSINSGRGSPGIYKQNRGKKPISSTAQQLTAFMLPEIGAFLEAKEGWESLSTPNGYRISSKKGN
jgi:hypothetical protein